MSKFVVKGGKKLNGVITVSGSKNAALPIICAALLTNEKSVISNVPDIADVQGMINILEALGVSTKFEKNTLHIDPSKMSKGALPDENFKKMRASILVLPSLIHRFNEVKIPFPGGCVLGKRSVATHTHAFREFGCKVLDEENGLHIKVAKLKAETVILPEMSVTATENAVMLASLIPGKSEIRLTAIEPHVQDLCHFLKKMGAKISGIGTTTLTIEGVKKLHGVKHKVIGDYLEAGTLILAAVATKGDVVVNGFYSEELDSFLQKLSEMGAKFTVEKRSVHVMPCRSLKAPSAIRTSVHPGFPTDLQAPFSVLLTQSKGVTKIFETLFEGRLNYLFELEKMDARVEILNPHQAIMIGPRKLKGMTISSCDIRAGAAMVIAALIASGETEVDNINYIDRGYERLHEKLQSLGADIVRAEP